MSASIPCLDAPSFGGPSIVHGFFTRRGGVSTGIYRSLNAGFGSDDDPAAVAENRARIGAALNLPAERLVTAHQIHSARAVTLETPWRRDAAPKADGMATATPGLALGVLTADCLPVLLADPAARIVGAAHAGWRGALGGVLEATVAAMETLGAAAADIKAALGPCIQRARFEVGLEVLDAFTAEDAEAARCFHPASRADKRLLDLQAYAAARLARAGVRDVEPLNHCTYDEEADFYSYRRATHRGEPDCGRLISAIALI